MTAAYLDIGGVPNYLSSRGRGSGGTPIPSNLWTTAKANPYMSMAVSGMQEAADASKQANLSRYEDILGQYNTLSQQTRNALAPIPGMYQGISDFYGQRTAEARQDLANQGFGEREATEDYLAAMEGKLRAHQGGLAGSYWGNLMSRALPQARSRIMGEMEERQARNRLNTLGQYTAAEGQSRGLVPQATAATAMQQFNVAQQPLGFMERRTDTGPTMQDASQLSQYLGTGQAAIPNYMKIASQAGTRA